MIKEKVIECIEFVKSKRPQPYIQDELNIVKGFVEKQEELDLQKLWEFIYDRQPTKMGGQYIHIGKALDFVKHTIRKAIKDERN